MGNLPPQRNAIINEGAGINIYCWQKSATLYDDLFNDLYSTNYSWEQANGVNVLSSVISFHYIPYAFTLGTARQVKVGSQTLETLGYYTSDRFIQFTEGTITLPHTYQNYLDYPPYTRCVIHLPFIGEAEIDHTPFINTPSRNIKIVHSIDIVTGDLVTFLCDSNNNVYYTFKGNCALHMPLSSADYSRNVSGIMQAIAGAGTVIGGAVMENIGMVAGGLSALGTGIAQATLPAKTTITGGLSSSLGYMGSLTTYVTYTEPDFDSSIQGYHVLGKPYYKYRSLTNATGFTKIGEINLTGIPCQKNELDEIEALLKSGVIL